MVCRSLLEIIRDVRMVAKHPGVHQRYALVVILARVVIGRDDLNFMVNVFVVEHFSRNLDVIVGCRRGGVWPQESVT